MSKAVRIEITESAQQLKALLTQQSSVASKERVQALYLLRSGQLSQVLDVAKALGRDRRTVQRWLRHYRSGGLAKLLAPRQGQGRKRAIPPAAFLKLQQRLQQSEGFHGYGEVVQWLRYECGVSVSYAVAHTTVRYRLKSKLKVPRPRSIKQDPTAIAQFKKNCPNC